MNIHAKNQKNPQSGYPGNLATNRLTNCNGGNHRAQRQSLKEVPTIEEVTNNKLKSETTEIKTKNSEKPNVEKLIDLIQRLYFSMEMK